LDVEQLVLSEVEIDVVGAGSIKRSKLAAEQNPPQLLRVKRVQAVCKPLHRYPHALDGDTWGNTDLLIEV